MEPGLQVCGPHVSERSERKTGLVVGSNRRAASIYLEQFKKWRLSSDWLLWASLPVFRLQNLDIKWPNFPIHKYNATANKIGIHMKTWTILLRNYPWNRENVACSHHLSSHNALKSDKGKQKHCIHRFRSEWRRNRMQTPHSTLYIHISCSTILDFN